MIEVNIVSNVMIGVKIVSSLSPVSMNEVKIVYKVNGRC